MAGNDTAALVVALSAQLTKFEKDMDKAVGIADQKTRQIENSFSKINPSAAGIGNFFEKLTSVAGIVGAIAGLKELVSEVAHFEASAGRIGLTVAEFQKFRFAIVATGGDVSTADAFLNRFSKTISEAGQGTGDLYKTLRLNNIAIKDTAGQLLPMNVLLGKFADLVKNTKSPQDQLNLAMLVGGRQAGPALVDALKNGSEGLREFGIEADRAGVVLDDGLVRRAKEINTKWDILWERLKAGAKTAGVTIAEEFDKTISETNKRNTQGAEDLKKSMISAWDSIVAYFETHSPNFNRLKSNIQDFLAEEQQRAAQARPRQGADITSPLTGGVDSRFDKAKADITALTKLYNEQDEQFRKIIERSKERAAVLGIEAAGVGSVVGETERLKTAVELESQAKQQNIPLTEARKTKILEEAAAVGAATKALEQARVAGEIKFGAGTAFLTPEDLAIAQRLKGLYGDDIPAALASSEAAALRLNNVFSEFSNTSRDTLKSFATDMRTSLQSGATAWQSFANAGVNALNKIADKLMSMAIDNLWAQAFGGSGGGFGGILSALFGGGGGVLPGGAALGQGGIGHAAGGTENWRGGPTWVGENGPEILNLPRGSQVIPNDVARGMGGGTGTIINIANNNDFRGVDPSMRAFIVTQQRVQTAESERRILSQVAALSKNAPAYIRKSG